MSYVVVVKKSANQEINPIYLDSLVRDGYNAWVSLTEINNETNSINIQITDEDQILTTEDLVAIQNEFLSSELYFAFGKKEEGFLRDNIQPFSILERGDSKSTVCAAFMLGEFPEYKKEGSHLHSAFYALNEYILPKLKKTARAFVCEPEYTKKDMDNFRDAISDGVERREFSKFIDTGDGGIILLVANGNDNTQGNAISHVKEGVIHEFSWGWTNYPMDYSESSFPEKEEQQEKKDDPKPQSIFDRVKNNKKKEDKTPDTTVEDTLGKLDKKGMRQEISWYWTGNPEEPQTLATSHGAALTSTPATTTQHDTTVEDMLGKFKIERRLSDGFMRPFPHPTGKHSNSFLKDVYKAICGACPSNYKNLPFIKPTTTRATALHLSTFKDFKEAGTTILEKIKDTASHHIPASPSSTENNKKEAVKETVTSPEPVPSEPVPTETPSTETISVPPWEHNPRDSIPILSHEDYERMKLFHNDSGIQMLLDTSSFVLPSGGAKQEKERMLPSLCSKMNWEILNTLRYPFEYAVALGKHNPKALAMLWCDLRNELIRRLSSEERAACFPTEKEEKVKKLFGGIKPRKSA